MDKHKIPTLVVLAFLVVSVITGVFLVQQQQYFRLSASTKATPLDVRISNITDNSFTVSFHTKTASIPSVNWGQGEDLSDFANPMSLEQSQTHSVNVTGLVPEAKYNFKILIAGDSFDNNGVPWSVTTGKKLSQAPVSKYYSGKIITSAGQPAKNSIVYLQIGGASLISTTTSENGTWIVPSSTFRTQTLGNYFDNQQNSLISIFVQGGNLGVSAAQVYSSNATSVPDMKLGSSYDFTSMEVDTTGSLPNAEVQLPENEAVSRFELSDTPPKPSR